MLTLRNVSPAQARPHARAWNCRRGGHRRRGAAAHRDNLKAGGIALRISVAGDRPAAPARPGRARRRAADQGARRHDAPDSVGDRRATREARSDPCRPALEPHLRTVPRGPGRPDGRRRTGRWHAERPQLLPLEQLAIELYRGRSTSAGSRCTRPASGRYSFGITGRGPGGRRLPPGDYSSTSPPRRSTAVRRRADRPVHDLVSASCAYSRHVVSDGVHA